MQKTANLCSSNATVYKPLQRLFGASTGKEGERRGGEEGCCGKGVMFSQKGRKAEFRAEAVSWADAKGEGKKRRFKGGRVSGAHASQEEGEKGETHWGHSRLLLEVRTPLLLLKRAR